MPSTPTPEQSWIPAINGPALRLARTRKGLTQRGLAEACARHGIRVDPANLNRAEHGRPGALGVWKIPPVADVLGVDFATLLTTRGMELMGYCEKAS